METKLANFDQKLDTIFKKFYHSKQNTKSSDFSSKLGRIYSQLNASSVEENINESNKDDSDISEEKNKDNNCSKISVEDAGYMKKNNESYSQKNDNKTSLNFDKKFTQYNKSIVSFRKINEIAKETINKPFLKEEKSSISPSKTKSIGLFPKFTLPALKHKREIKDNEGNKKNIFSNHKLKKLLPEMTRQNINNNVQDFKATKYTMKKNTVTSYNLKELLNSNFNKKKTVNDYKFKEVEDRRKDVIVNLVKTTDLDIINKSFKKRHSIKTHSLK